MDFESSFSIYNSAHVIKDPIHDCIPISPRLKSFIDTPQYQRLRDIKQLGVSYTVWPGAAHNRFEHGLGVAYLGRLLAIHLQKCQPELKITDRDVECVEIAGLCHDLGHGPWSHFWDSMFIPVALKGSDWKHEDASEMMFDFLIEDNGIELDPDDGKFIKALIAGDSGKCSQQEKKFLFDIIANKRNGIDVDKFDYIQRDSHMIGKPLNISLQRMIYSARVLNDQICYDIKDAHQIYDICATRFKLHKIVYNHKVAKAIEYMMLDALLSANRHLRFAEQLKDPRKYLHLNDSLMLRIESSEEPELEEARAILKRIRVRDLYKCVDYKVIDWPNRDIFRENVTAARIVEEAKKAAKALAKGAPIHANNPQTRDENLDVDDSSGVPDYQLLTEKDVVVDYSIMHHGMKEKNPLDFIEFYSKRKRFASAKAGPGDYCSLMPAYFAEVLLRVYTKQTDFFGIVQAGYRAVLAELEKMSTSGDEADFMDSFPFPSLTNQEITTPPTTDPPSTPRALSRNQSSGFGVGSLSRNSSANFGPGTFSRHTSANFGAAPFSNNNFTTVSPTFRPPSPTRAQKQPKSRKRTREQEDTPSSDADLATPAKKLKE
ncbi:hypothetical protein M378DRAFT_673967 [Amanita muscaria Koide BX008]|uniref:HD/PDEase domain-containing protein n=1 Tax=Amanita muscaria (strain Koide BX008) TaxID=946122 RepID=A0A0C2SJA5_AMAMK|nr:hypothetical protein M378DRAFT_673967 [Amanita muscaria Koide BX008]